MAIKIDSTDKEILRHLQQDALLTTKELASRLNLSPTPVYERVRRLEKDGVIKKYVALVDREKVLKDLMVFCSIRLKEHAQEAGARFVQEIVRLDEVQECYNISGDYDFMLKIVVHDMREYQAFLMNKLASLENIGSTHSIFVMSEIKHETAFLVS
ncbi:Lrp/AsnC family leucine-responsive transcriptional regulator/Lrp/AsnC family transcriptional regulator [Arcicella aurantiaca]|jgi:DNA-binding Lrp family transcriptional regulator|uniref:Lrp/AsnC family leucine-responsive transcriptional regulator/Lrp/AsnC family transcriptional regulator n=1 Tax=Arcicella aurantiaca TaxID=591202 RepID=A0A316EAK0_9BACT|nr:Lrp/AsnC family transcriptional regulator [Arcicella aurantiaca]PWK26672.1 Lrp/AsnC family leucine-responsive transcriptional regulator/Lrp/AsnC family transcriptional regulator [Arcicella aurantiaca]